MFKHMLIFLYKLYKYTMWKLDKYKTDDYEVFLDGTHGLIFKSVCGRPVVFQPLTEKDGYCKLARYHAAGQIVHHHTAGGPQAYQTKEWFDTQPGPIATHFIIGDDGTILQLFGLEYWAYHVGAPHINLVEYPTVDVESIGIEVCNYGQLQMIEGNPYTAYNQLYTEEYVELKQEWRGSKFYAEYSDAQMDSLVDLSWALIKVFNLDIMPAIENFKANTFFQLTSTACIGKQGLATHVNIRTDKQDMWPQIKYQKVLHTIFTKYLTGFITDIL